MGQQLSIPNGFNVNENGFPYPPWYNSHYDVKPSTITACTSTLLTFSNGDMAVYKRIQKFDKSVTPMDFMFRQLFNRLFIMSPAFIRKNLNIPENYKKSFRAKDILNTEFARKFFNDIIMESCKKMSSCTTSDQLNGMYVTQMQSYYKKYGIDAYLYSDIGTVILLVLSDCIGEGFLKSVRAWMDFLSKGLKTLIDLKLINNEYGSFSLRETMLKLHQPYIEWSDGILSTGYLPIDRQHQWLLTIVNVLIHVNTGNQVEISINDVLDALYDYAWIHFTEEEELFMNNEKYPQFAIHKKQHTDFLAKLDELRQELSTKRDSVVGKELLDYCIAWLTNHIRVTDRKMINCCIPPDVLKNSTVLFTPTK
ncbi:hypothetical protein WA556_000995, partial [Blastocystis sp. ATCC 50177/Nand II]